MDESAEERLDLELGLLKSMYPDALKFDEKAHELSFSSSTESTDKLVLRLGSTYPAHGTPEVISARDKNGRDLREEIKMLTQDVCRSSGDMESPGEVLDAVLAAYLERLDVSAAAEVSREGVAVQEAVETPKTIIIWLHHLLATGKRKLAIHPSVASDKIRGLTKPGYPGVLVFSGSKSAVDAHVHELKSQNWQAFAVRYEEDEEWEFAEGIREVETMGEAAQAVEESKREIFLKVIGVK